MTTNMTSTSVIPASSGIVTIEQQRKNRLKKLAISQVVLGSIYGLLVFLEYVTYRYFYGIMFIEMLAQMIPAFLVVVGGTLLLCCNNCNCCCKSNCALKGHYAIGILSSVLLVVFSIDDIILAKSYRPYHREYSDYYRYYSDYYRVDRVFDGYVCPILVAIFAFVNMILVIWSTVIAGQLACACCRGKQLNASDQPQVVYVQQGTPENPQIVMMQLGTQSATHSVTIQPTTSHNQEINHQEPSQEVEPETHEVSTLDANRPPKYEAFQSEQPVTMVTESDTQLLIPE